VKECARFDLTFCCLQKVRWWCTGSKLTELNSGEKYEFHWTGYQKNREDVVGL